MFTCETYTDGVDEGILLLSFYEKHSISILKTYIILEYLFLKNIFIKTSNIFKNILEKNLTSEDPNLFLFDIYRLNYICKIK